jgi:hypothetical protein
MKKNKRRRWRREIKGHKNKKMHIGRENKIKYQEQKNTM